MSLYWSFEGEMHTIADPSFIPQQGYVAQHTACDPFYPDAEILQYSPDFPQIVSEQENTAVDSATVSPSQLTQPVASQSHVSTPPVKRETHDHSISGSWKCPNCNRGFGRKQERDRHYRTYFPYYVYCPSRTVNCSFRTDRPSDFKSHWAAKHKNEGSVPAKEEFEIYDLKDVLGRIENGNLTLDVATNYACLLVEAKAQDIGKQDVWEDSWGRKEKKAEVVLQ